jgi:3-hydroxyacyl-CoA dehydrogenase
MVASMPNTVAVIGGGLIGTSWAALFQSGGCRVTLWDPNAQARDDALPAVARALQQLRSLGLDRAGTLRVCATLAEALEGAEWIQENAPEKIELKQSLYADIERDASPTAVLATSTSSLVWSMLAQGMQRPHRLLIAHPFNPPHLIPLVELYGVDSDVVDRAMDFYTSLGRAPIRLKKESLGHVANRLSSALWREAVHIVAEGIASVEDVDRAMVEGPGLRWSIQGPHLSYHLGGGVGGIAHYLEHLGPSQARRWKDLGQPELTPEVCTALVAGVMAEARDRSVRQLEAERDERLIRTLQSRHALSKANSTAAAPSNP